MGLRDALFGRKQLKHPAPDRLFALSTAQVTLEVELGLRSAGAAAVCFKRLSAGEFMRGQRELAELLEWPRTTPAPRWSTTWTSSASSGSWSGTRTSKTW